MSAKRSEASGRRYVFMTLKLAVSIVLLTVLFSRVAMAGLWAHARSASFPWLMAALGLQIIVALAGTWRWHMLLDAQGVHVSRLWLLRSFLVANFFNNFLPSNIGGDVIRIS